MALFPDMGPRYLITENDKSMQEFMESFYNDAREYNEAFQAEADRDCRFAAGDQGIFRELYGVNISTRKIFNYNRIRRIVNMISGHQRKNRKSINVVPVEGDDQVTSDQLTQLIYWMVQKEGMLHTISDAFEDSLISGLGLVQLYIDYRNDPISGDIKMERCPYNSVVLDPYFKKPDLSDCRALWKRSFLTPNEIKSCLPGHDEEIEALREVDPRDNKFNYMPENFGVVNRYQMIYDEFYYRDYRKQKKIVNTITGETYEWQSDNEDALKEFLRLSPESTIIDTEVPTVKLAISINGKVFYNDQNPMGLDSYPFVPILSYFQPELINYADKVQGVVRGLRDPQFLYNRLKSIELSISESQINSGWKYKEDALVNPKDIFKQGSGRGLALKKTAQMTDVEQIVPTPVPPSLAQLAEGMANEIQQISGVNEELLGAAQDDKAGVLSMLRQGAGLTTLNGLFDKLDQAQRLIGNKLIVLIQKNFAPGKIQRVLNEEPSPKFYNKTFGTYDCQITAGLNTETQKQMAFAQMLNLKELGINIPDSVIVDNMTVENKDQIIQAMQQQQQQEQEAAQRREQIELAQITANIDLARARSAADRGLSVERASRVSLNTEEAIQNRARAASELADARESRADSISKRQSAMLDFIKALKELDGTDFANLEKLIAVAQMTAEPAPESTYEEAQSLDYLSQGLRGDLEMQKQFNMQEIEAPAYQQQQQFQQEQQQQAMGQEDMGQEQQDMASMLQQLGQ